MAASVKAEQQSPQHQTPTKSSASLSQAVATNQHQSPRNMAKSGSGSGASNATPYVSFGALEVSKALRDGEKFVKWDEVSYVHFCLVFLSSLVWFFSFSINTSSIRRRLRKEKKRFPALLTLHCISISIKVIRCC